MKGMTESNSGADALALGVLEAGVRFVASYPGAPITAVVDRIVDLTSTDQVRVEWMSNEKTAIEMAFGFSLGGNRSLVCMKSVGLNIALDPLMAYNLSGCHAGFVLLVGDDPGGWGSQNEQDSRSLALAAEIPLLEPTSVSDAKRVMRYAFQLSEERELPVMIRVTRALVVASEENQVFTISEGIHPSSKAFKLEADRWVVLPINVVERHRDLLDRLDSIREEFEVSTLNEIKGRGPYGVIAAGFVYQKLLDLLQNTIHPDLRLMRLGTLFPLPERKLTDFLRTIESVIVLEETAPIMEREIRAVAQRRSLSLPIYGRDTGHVARVGELFAPQLALALNRFSPSLTLPSEGRSDRSRPSREPLCEDCPYHPTFTALRELHHPDRNRDGLIVVGDPGCMVRGQLPPYELMDVKTSLGSSIAMAAGIDLSLSQPGDAVDSDGASRKRVIALSGDSGFFHSGFTGLMDAVQVGAEILVVILDNGTTALSGGQPHPGSHVDARGEPRRVVNVMELARLVGGKVRVVDVDKGEDIRDVLESALNEAGLSVVIARGQCPRWSGV